MFKGVFVLSFIVGTRFFGLFIILPVFSFYAKSLNGSNEVLTGIAVGIYALMQMLLQTFFGKMSDKFGRKIVILIGLIIFIVGSLVCAYANDIYTIIFGRFIQGCGAVGAVAIAMISDCVPEEKRGKAMAVMGSMIGMAFAISMIISPILSAKWGLESLFLLSGFLTLVCIVLLYTCVPQEKHFVSLQQNAPFLTLIKNKNLAIMNLTNFLQKMVMTMTFIAIPIILTGYLGYAKNHLWMVYTVSMIFGFIAMGFAGALGEKRGLAKAILLIGVLLFVLSFFAFLLSRLEMGRNLNEANMIFLFGVVLFFIGFNMHEPIMQSVASKFSKTSQKGEVLGIFNSAGYLGSFLGGVLGGVFLGHLGIICMAIFVMILGAIWFFILTHLSNPNLFKNLYLDNTLINEIALKSLEFKEGFIESYKVGDKLVIKYNKNFLNENMIKNTLGIS